MRKRILASIVILFITISILGGTGIKVSAAETSTSEVQAQNEIVSEGNDNFLNVNPAFSMEFPTDDNITKGTINNIVIYIAFKDQTTTMPKETLMNNAIESKKSFNGSSTSLKEFTSLISDNQLTVNSYFPQDTNGEILYYEAPYTFEEANRTEVLKEAFESVKNKIPSDLDVDLNNDGFIDNISFVCSSDFRSYMSSFNGAYSCGTLPNGKSVGRYNMLATYGFKITESRTISHEFLHSLGFPDMYDDCSWQEQI